MSAEAVGAGAMTAGTAYRPMPGRVVVEPIEAEDYTSPGGIFIPKSAQNEPQMGVVVAIGASRVTDYGVELEAPFEVGQTVVYGKYAGSAVEIGQKEVLVLQWGDIMLVSDEGGDAGV